jgi:CBS-domain-containing membrane protein
MADSKRNALYEHFQNLTASELAGDKDVISLKTNDTLDHAVDVMSKAKILSCPVTDDNDEIVGFLDMLDIAKYIVNAAPNDADLKEDELASLKVADRAIALIPVKTVANFTDSDAAVSVFKNTSATELIQLFATGVRRAVMTDSDKKICGLVSQSDIVRNLSKNLHMGNLKLVGEKTMTELGYAQRAVVTVKDSESVLHALKKMSKANVSALAIVNDEEALCGNFSASNLRGLYRQTLPEFVSTVNAFLTKHSPDSLDPVCRKPSDSLIEITNCLVEKGYHHLWVSTDSKPVGIISLTDIMNIILA